jgi:hypothetical protein
VIRASTVVGVISLAALTTAAYGLTVEGRQLRMADGAFVREDAEWLAARARYLLKEREYGRANDVATLLAGAAPAALSLEGRSLAAHTKYFAVGHKESYLAFRDLYREEKNRIDATGAPPTEDDLARLATISREAISAMGTAYGAGAVSGARTISTYDSPTANTGAAEPQALKYDLRWSVNLVFLVRDYDKASTADAKAAVKAALDEKRTYHAFFRDVSMPKSTKERAFDDVRGSVRDRARKMLPGAIAREMQTTYNMEGFKFCLKIPVDIPELTIYAGRILEASEKEELTVEQYEDEGYVAFRATATARAEATTSLADALRYFGVDPYTWRPFLGSLEKEEKSPEVEEPPPPGGDAGGIPED